MPTTVTSSIGTSSRDYSTLQAWDDAAPANLVTSDQIWRGECYNDSLFTGALTIAGSTSDATRYKELTCAAGQSFMDNASVQTNELRFNQSNGVGVSRSTNYAPVVTLDEAYCRFSKIQVAFTGSSGSAITSQSGSPKTNTVIDFCIAEASANAGPTSAYGSTQIIRNTLMVNRGTSPSQIAGLRNGASMVNCTLVATKAAATVALVGAYSAATVKNCAIFNCTAVGSGTAANYTTCYTSAASPPTGCTQVAYDTSTGSGFENTTDSTRDFRIKSTSAMIDVGTTDATNAPVDIAGTARPSGAAYDIGAWEYVASGGNTAALTGQSTTGSQGTLVPSLSLATSGNSSTATQGAVTAALSLALSGNSATTSQGTVTPSLSLALTGNSATTAAGTPTSSVPGGVGLTGNEAISSPGAPVAALSLALTGNSATISAGTVTSALSQTTTLTGQSATATQGAPLAGLSLALAGNGATASTGILTPSTEGGTITVALTGNEAVASSGLVSPPAPFFSVSGGGIKRKPLKPLPSPFEEELKAPTVKLKRATVPDFSPQTFVPYAKMGLPKALSKALGEALLPPLTARIREPLPAEYDDDDIPDEVIMLALQ